MTERNSPIFREVQKFSSWILWFFVVLFFVLVYTVVKVAVAVGSTGMQSSSIFVQLIVMVAIFLAVSLFFLLARLETEVRADGLYVRFFPFHIRFKKFTVDDLKEYYARQYSPLAEYGGWGIRCGLFGAGRAYNAKGSQGVQARIQKRKTPPHRLTKTGRTRHRSKFRPEKN